MSEFGKPTKRIARTKLGSEVLSLESLWISLKFGFENFRRFIE